MLWAILLLAIVQSSNGIIGIHRTNTLKPACENTAWTKTGAEDFSESANCKSMVGDIFQPSPVESNAENISTNDIIEYSKFSAAIYSVISAFMVGLSGILPLIMLPKQGHGTKYLNRLLSFAVGGLLGDVFLHLLPESWNAMLMSNSSHSDIHNVGIYNGLWVLCGFVSFWCLEKLFPDDQEASELEKETHLSNGNISHQNCNGNNNTAAKHMVQETECCCGGHQIQLSNGVKKEVKGQTTATSSKSNVKMSGYLNLLANFIDNFTHGLAIGGSYLIGRWVGILTTLAILLHEIPHEIGDFAILLRAGFDRWHAAKMQLFTATGGLIGAAFAHFVDANATGGRVVWILPFTSGGFIYIALCTVVPDLLTEKSPKESFIQMLLMISAIGVMGLVSIIE